MAVPGVSLLNRVVVRVWESAQDAPSQLDFELHTITLRYLGQIEQWIRSGVTRHELLGDLRVMDCDKPSLDSATIAAFGCSFTEFGRRSLIVTEARERELWDCIPDFDPTLKRPPSGRIA